MAYRLESRYAVAFFGMTAKNTMIEYKFVTFLQAEGNLLYKNSTECGIVMLNSEQMGGQPCFIYQIF